MAPASRKRSGPRADDLTVLNEIAKALTSTLQLPEIMRIVLARIKTLTFAEATSLLLYDAGRDELVFAATETLREATFAGLRAPPQHGIAAWVARTGESALVNDAAADWRCAGPDEPLPPCDRRHLLAVPLLRGGQVAGVIEIADRYDGLPFQTSDQRALERAAAAISQHADFDALSRDGAAVRALLADVATAVPSQAAALLLYGPGGRSLTFSASRRLEAGVVDGLRLSTARGIAGWVARHRQAVRLDDASQDPRHDRSIELETSFTPRSMLCVPLVSKDTLLGVIQVMNRLDGHSFDDYELRLVQVLADHAAIAIENASLYRQAEQAALTDDLTGLGNSRHLNQLLPALIETGRPLSLLVLDFDNFKQLVDRYGHLIGSQTIAQLGRVMAALIRPGDFAARFGGDEFVVVLPDTSVADALRFGEQLRTAIAQSTRLEGRDVDLTEVTASIGVAAFPDHARDADALISAADAAMYAVKRGGKNAVALTQR